LSAPVEILSRLLWLRDTAARVAGNKRPVAAHKPPALPALQDRNPPKQPRRLGIGQREQREFLTSV